MLTIRQPLHPCNPMLHAAYVPLLDPDPPATVPADVLARVRELTARRNTAPEDELDAIDTELVGRTYWYVLRPDEIARAIIGSRWRVSVEEATRILAACGEAGYDIAGNGAPEHAHRYPGDYGYPEYAPVRGAARDVVIWSAAEYWARMATQHTYISLGDCHGFLPRPVQYDQPGEMHPVQQAALTFGPEPSVYMRRHTRRLLVVRPGGK